MGYVSRLLFAGVSSCFRALFGFLAAFLLRLGKGEGEGVDSSEKRLDFSESSEESFYESEKELIMSERINDDFQSADPVVEDDEVNNGGFKFRFPTYEEFINGKNKVGCESLQKMGFIEDEKMVALAEDLKQKQSDCEGGGEDVFDSENENSEKEKREFSKAESQKAHDFADENLFQSEQDSSLFTDSDSASLSFEHMQSLMSRLVDSYSECFLSDDDFMGDFEFDESNDVENQESDASSALMDESLKELGDEFLSDNDFHEDVNNSEDLELENLKPETESDLDNGDANKLESLWEHQDLLEQLKMELKKVRATGLPTILEESESPKMDDLKPWKIDEKFQRQDCITELMMFSKSYRERMRKFDILTYQKLYAIGFLQKDGLKDPIQLLSSQKSSGPGLKKSLLLKNIWPFKHKSGEIDEPMVKFMNELQCELEVAYVGQTCLSWEFLHWQYGKALDLWDSDPRGIHRYNEVAGEFQQFQVLLQRFIEDEPFQGPRVQYYIKSRYAFRNLLQVPVVREDNLKDRKKARRFEKGDFAITSDVLVEILEECIRIFWRFVKADISNESSGVSMKCCHDKGVHPGIENADDSKLLMEVRRSLQKKERKLRETLRSENCILRQFRMRNEDEDDSDHVLYFFSQVDMKLVSRVLRMSRLTREQLVWCHNKLSRISFVNRRIHVVDPSFLFFPC